MIASLKDRETLGVRGKPGDVQSAVISDPDESLSFTMRSGAIVHSSQDMAFETCSPGVCRVNELSRQGNLPRAQE